MLYGYARVSTTDQDASIQVRALKAAGCRKVLSEKVSGTKRQGREKLELLLSLVDPGDTIVVTRIDRLARSAGDLQDIIRELKARGVALRATEQNVDTSTAAGKAFFDMLGAFAEFETNIRAERQREGIAAAKVAGRYGGTPLKHEPAHVRAMIAEHGVSGAARVLEMSKSSVFAYGPSGNITLRERNAVAAGRRLPVRHVRAPTRDQIPNADAWSPDDIATPAE